MFKSCLWIMTFRLLEHSMKYYTWLPWCNLFAVQLGRVERVLPIPGIDSRLRPNIVVTDAEKKKVLLVDVTVPFENRSPAFHEARARKESKYTPLAETLRAQGYEVQVHALIVGALGSWDPRNEMVLRACGVG
ncbi:hypothetical protein KIL84_006816 [Mauremys mutica]|uniref:Uncharacterized protein n=1 Tax=Mauremys mutica TaxID=74926 RepID=A0A9D3X239_9SAUR|nr:hypothetical protein KIL84_006816 [Mauremys mutica]